MSETNNSVIKAMKILELFRDHEKLTVARIYEITKYSKSSVNRILASFEELGYVVKISSAGEFRLTNKLYYLGVSTNINRNIIDVAKPFIEDLSRKVKLTVSLSVMEDYHAVIIHQRRSEMIVNVTPPQGNRSALNCTASGKVLVAFSEHPRQIVDAMHFDRRTPHSIMDKEVYWDVILRTQADGHTYEDEEIELGLYCLAAPILDPDGHVICSISVSGYREVVMKNIDAHLRELLICAEAISRAYSANY